MPNSSGPLHREQFSEAATTQGGRSGHKNIAIHGCGH